MLPPILTAITVLAFPFRVLDLYACANVRLPIAANMLVAVTVIAISCGVTFIGIEN